MANMIRYRDWVDTYVDLRNVKITRVFKINPIADILVLIMTIKINFILVSPGVSTIMSLGRTQSDVLFDIRLVCLEILITEGQLTPSTTTEVIRLPMSSHTCICGQSVSSYK